MITEAEQIKQNVINHICWDGRVDASDIKIEITDNRVRLFGTVPTYSARKAALEDTLLVAGVNSVQNDLIVSYPSGKQVPDDNEIQIKIENMFIWNPDLDSSDIKVIVDRGVVTLKGSVGSFWKKMKAEELASEVTGVISVENMLAVVPSHSAIDEEIAEEIVLALNRMVHVNADRINVEVVEGKVTLSGYVPDLSGYYAAYDAARYTPDVVDVVNKLKVE